jgi:ribosomal protein S18 acetylase RimI-like enzyme
MLPLITPGIKIREAHSADHDDIVSALRAAHAQFADVLPARIYQAYLANILDVRGRLADSDLLVAELDGEIVGTITYYPDASKEGWDWPAAWAGIRAAGVVPQARGMGIGRRLVEACIARARAQKVEAICLHTAEFMEAAVIMYERIGFRRRPEFDQDISSFFQADGEASPIIVLGYWLKLSQSPSTE